MKKKLFISVAALGLIVGGLIGCNNNNKSSEGSKSSTPSSSQPSKPSSSSAAPSSTPSSSSQAPISQATVNQTVTQDTDGNGAKIATQRHLTLWGGPKPKPLGGYRIQGTGYR